MSPEPSLDAASVARREFTFVRRGCDPHEVRAFVREVAELIEDLEGRLEAQRERAERAEQFDQHRLIELVGEETARVLDAARDAAAEIRTKAQDSAARLVGEGQDERQQILRQAETDAATRKVELLAEVEELRRQAEAELDQRRAEGESLAEEIRREALSERDRLIAEGERARLQGEADAERIRDAARQEGHHLVAEAEAVRERVLGDLARRRHTARQQLERLNAARERLLAAYAVVRRTVDEATTELTIALPEAKVAGDNAMRRARGEPEATVEELEAELSAARLVGLLDGDLPATSLDTAPDTDSATPDAATSSPDDADTTGTATVQPDHDDTPTDQPDSASFAATHQPDHDDTPTDLPDGAHITDVATPSGRTGSPVPGDGAPSLDGGDPSAVAQASSEPAHSGRRGLWPFRRHSPASDARDATADEHAPGPDPQGEGSTATGDQSEPPPDEPVSDQRDHVTRSTAEEVKSGGPSADGPPAVASVNGAAAPAPEAPMPTAASTTTKRRASGDAPKVDELFARIKAQRSGQLTPEREGEANADGTASAPARTGAEAANGTASSDEAAAAAPSASAAATTHSEPVAQPSPVGADAATVNGTDAADPDDPDAGWLHRRDDTLSAVEATLARRLKRVLADEQNEVLDLVRQAKPGTLDELVPAFEPHVARYATVAGPELEAAAAEGAAVVGGTPPASCAAIADQLGEALVSPMRERIGRSLEESGGDRDEVTGRLRALYRQWKRQRIGEVVRHYAAAAYAAGTFTATRAGTELRWVVDRSRDACPDAEDNALARGVRKGDPFPTGDRCPPAHPGCRCLVVPATPRGGPT